MLSAIQFRSFCTFGYRTKVSPGGKECNCMNLNDLQIKKSFGIVDAIKQLHKTSRCIEDENLKR